MEKKKKKGLRKGIFIGCWSLAFVLMIGVATAATVVTNYYDSVITQFLGTIGGSGVVGGGDEQEFKTNEERLAAQKELNEKIADEAITLLKNDNNCLPLAKGNKVSIFGMAGSTGFAGTGSGAAASSSDSLYSSFSAAGLEVNNALLDYYKNNSTPHGIGTAAGSGNDRGDWSLGKEADFPTTGDVYASLDNYKDAAIMVLARGGGEGGDLSQYMENHGGTAGEHYLELSPSEKATLQGIKDCGKFSKIILIVNSANTLELGFIDDYDIDSVVWYAGLGQNGMVSVGKVFAGDINPSGHTVDTYVYDDFSAPSMQNFGDFRYKYDGKLVGSYLNYAESIYIGYRYYETRYADKVLGNANVGAYDYANTVIYPFGYGLSYTSFKKSNLNVTIENKIVNVSIDVQNTGTKAGKDALEIYYQSEYTDYDKTNGIEKSAINLVEFGKTDLLQPNETKTYSISFPLEDMKSYDAKNQKTYILENCKYYITVADDAHQAINNILLKQSVAAGNLVGTGDANLVYEYTHSTLDKIEEGAQNKVTNQFDDALLSNATYLSRSNWVAMDGASVVTAFNSTGSLTTATGQEDADSLLTDAAGNVGTWEITPEEYAKYVAVGYEASGNPKAKNSYSGDYKYGEENGLELLNIKGLDYDDPKFDALINELKLSQLHELFGHAGYGTIYIPTINKPKTFEYDGPTGIASLVNGSKGFSFPNEICVAATWNKELVLREGQLIGEDAINMGVSGWYAPAVNIHRAPFSGRNYEYYSEDPVLSGKLASEVTKGVQEKGMYVYLKHYALNDQETNRNAYGNVCAMAQEQAIREIYLKAFEIPVKEANALGIMDSMNRVGFRKTAGHYALNTAVLRNEWGFKGIVITDYLTNPGKEFSDQYLASGGDLIMSSGWNSMSGVLTDAKQNWCRSELRRAAHNTLFVIGNSLAMNGIASGVKYDPGFPVYKLIITILWVVVAAAVGVLGFRVYRTIPWSQEKWENRKRISKKGWIIIASTSSAVIIAIVVIFFVWLLPILMKAFVI